MCLLPAAQDDHRRTPVSVGLGTAHFPWAKSEPTLLTAGVVTWEERKCTELLAGNVAECCSTAGDPSSHRPLQMSPTRGGSSGAHSQPPSLSTCFSPPRVRLAQRSGPCRDSVAPGAAPTRGRRKGPIPSSFVSQADNFVSFTSSTRVPTRTAPQLLLFIMPPGLAPPSRLFSPSSSCCLPNSPPKSLTFSHILAALIPMCVWGDPTKTVLTKY